MEEIVSQFLRPTDAEQRAALLNYTQLPPYESIKLVAVRVEAGNIVESSFRNGATTKTLFRIASMTKSFVACAILILRDRGLLKLSDHVSLHVPELSHLG